MKNFQSDHDDVVQTLSALLLQNPYLYDVDVSWYAEMVKMLHASHMEFFYLAICNFSFLQTCQS